MQEFLSNTSFIHGKYHQLYIRIVSRGQEDRKIDAKTAEKHHILPRCMGGSNKKSNLTVLSFREHILVHRILIRITYGINRAKMSHALNMTMCVSVRTTARKPSSRDIVNIKRDRRMYPVQITEEQRLNLSVKAVARWATLSEKEKAEILMAAQTPEAKQKRKQSLAQTLSDPVQRQRRSENRIKFLNENKESHIAQVKKSWQDPVIREKRSVSISKATKNPKFIEAQRTRWEKHWENNGGRPVLLDEKVRCPLCEKCVKMMTRHYRIHHKGETYGE